MSTLEVKNIPTKYGPHHILTGRAVAGVADPGRCPTAGIAPLHRTGLTEPGYNREE